ncbi:hypothetical protein LMG667_02620 [Xanthomonas euvesicatoria]|uniref:replication initiation protein n=1 Tax=Xanthomonas euvesicatoria TaxID=456327 RepID=UPI00080E6DA8|nr:replication initiation protein [Xanthomonas euvesicatoria]OCG90331.1 hypothetical protein LMG667_02620 [Xanthomonas euvesicatoria]
MPSQVQRSADKLRAVERQRKRQAEFAGFHQGDLLGVGLNAEQEFLPAAVLKKSTGAVHMKNSVSGLQRKVYNVLIEHAYEELPNPEVKLHKIPLQDLMVMVGFDSKNTGHLKTAVKGLMTNLIEWNVIKEEGIDDWEASTALAAVRFRDGFCYYEFSEILRQRMYHPGRFAKLDLMEMRELSTATAVALYENTTRYINMSRTPWWPVETWRAVLGNTAETYDEFKRFKEKALIPALGQIALHTRLKLTPEYRREGRRITHISFVVERDKQALKLTPPNAGEGDATPATIASEPRASALEMRLMAEFCLTLDQSRQAIAEHGEQKVTDVANYCTRRFRAGNVQADRLAGYFLVTLTKYEAGAKTSSLELEKAQEAKASQDRARAARDEANDRDTFNKIYRGLSYQVIEAISQDERVQLYEDFEAHLQAEHPSVLKSWRDPAQQGLASCQAFLRNFVAQHFLPSKEDAMSAWQSAGKNEQRFNEWLEGQISDRQAERVVAGATP